MNLFVSLKYLVALDDHRHFGRAALACHVTQPALSNAIRALEASFGVAVVKRGRSFAGFTPEGERILASARLMLREHELLQQDLLSSAENPCGNLVLGAVPTAMPVAARFAALLQQDLLSSAENPCGNLVLGAVPTAMPVAARFAALLRDRHPGIRPTLRSMSSVEIETGLESLALDMGLGYTERLYAGGAPLRVVPQYVEHYFLLSRREPGPHGAAHEVSPQFGEEISWAEAAHLPLCLLSPEMHNRTVVDRAFTVACGVPPQPAIETNAILTLALSVRAGQVCSILPGALVDAIKGYGELLARPLVAPCVEVPIAFMVHDTNRPSRTLEAALALAQDENWLLQLRRHTGPLPRGSP